MMRAILLCLALTSAGLAADAEPDAKLSSKLIIKDLPGGFTGFTGFTGKVYAIEVDGSYVVGNEFNGKVNVTARGKLSAKELASVAAAARKFGADTLKNTGLVKDDPRVVTVMQGKNTATLKLPRSSGLPEADEKEMAGRFAGIVKAVTAAIPKAKDKGGLKK